MKNRWLIKAGLVIGLTTVVGYGKAEKRQVIDMVTRILNLPGPPKPDDTADALAIAICHAHSGHSKLAAYFNQK